MFLLRKKLSLFMLAVIMLFGLFGCTAKNTQKSSNDLSSDKQSNEVKEQTPLIIRLAGGDTGLPNPFKHAGRGPGMSKMQILYDSLLEKDENGDIPWLAERWDVQENGTVYTFHIQKNALWHDGTPLTANDVEFTLSYYKEHPPVANDLLAGGKYIVSSTEVIDTHTIKITFDKFDNTYLTKIGGVRILPKHIWENIEDPMTYSGEDATIGSGPYKLESYDAQQGSYRFTAFDKYWGLKPAAAAIEWIPVSDSVLAFENQEIDLINAAADVLPKYQSDSSYTIKTAHSYHSYRLMMNMEAVEELKDINLRKAIAYGIDNQDLVDKVARGAATVSSQGYVLSESSWYNKDIEQYRYDKEKALGLLEGKKYSFKLLTDNSAASIKTAELIKISLSEVGIELIVESVESKVRDNAVKTGEYELMIINSGGMGGDPDYLRSVYGKSASTIKGVLNPEIQSIAEAQASEVNEENRKQMIYDIQKLISDELPMIMLYGAVDNYVYKSEKYDGWMFRYDHSKCDHNKLSYLNRK